MNNVVLIGRLTRDPELRYVPSSGRAVANFTLAVDRGYSKERKMEMESRNEPTADFIRITVWGVVAENCAKYLKQGLQVAVQGRIQTGSYNNPQGERVYTFDVVANQVEFLEWGTPDNQGQGGQMPYEARPAYPQESKPSQGNDFSGVDGFHPTDNDDIPF